VKRFVYRRASTTQISFPVGGIGAGCIGIDGAGRLIDWEIFNRPAKATRNGFTHFALKAEARGRVLDARVLHGDVPYPYTGRGGGPSGFGFGVPRETLGGLPHFQNVEFHGSFPLAELRFSDPSFPGRVTLTAFNPFIPLNDRDSSLPAAFFTIGIRNDTARAIDYTAAFAIRNLSKAGTINRFRRLTGANMLHLTGTTDPGDVRYGDFAAATDAADVHAQTYWYRGGWFDALGVYWRDFLRCGPLRARTYAEPGHGDHGVLAARVRVPAGRTASVRFVFAWHVPTCEAYWKPVADGGARPPAPRTWRSYYASLFSEATAVARYCLKHWDRLERETRLFRDTLFASTLPACALDAVSANLSTLKTPTCLRLEDGSFYGWEGCGGESGCCEGSCTHVWNYAYALPFLFPALERSMRELDYRYNLRPDGGMAFRLQLPLGSERSAFRPCADGQFGGVLKVYRDWKICGDTDWMRRLWPMVRRSIEFAWSPSNEDRWDPDRTGVLHGRQHHTLDMELFGPNAWLSGFYLAALKAGAEMADACGEPAVAADYRALFARGAAWVRRHLFNGRYFVQRVDLDDPDVLTPFGQDSAIRSTYWSKEHGELKYQAGESCGIDQVLAQWHADLIGLGDVFDRRQTRRALASIHRHNFHASMRDVVNPCRLYCLDDEAGTTMFSWPGKTRKPAIPIPYAEETMHGFEYQAAAHLIMNGMVREGTAMVKAVRDRYDGRRRNPWNEIECGSNYARSMASYALLNAYSGFHFDLARGRIGFRPVRTANGRFRCFWSLGTAWGEIVLRPAAARLRVLGGTLALKSLGLDLAGTRHPLAVTLGKVRVACRREARSIVFEETITVAPDTPLRIDARPRAGRRSEKSAPP
jgi:non-lysosomal glucosylceramidase